MSEREQIQRVTPEESLTVVIAAYQEEEALAPLVAELYEALSALERLELIIVNDGSSDRTAEVMEGLKPPQGREGSLKLIHLPSNQGMGAALKAGYERASEAWVTFLPGDGQLAPSSLWALFEATRSGAALVTTRYSNRRYGPVRWLLSKGLRLLSALIIGTRVYSEGMYLIQRAPLQRMPLHSDSFMLNLEIPIRAQRSGLEVALAWIEVRARQGGRSSATQLGRISSTLRDIFALRLQLEREQRQGEGWLTRGRLFTLFKLLIVGGGLGYAARTGLLTSAAEQLMSLSPSCLLGAWLLMAIGLALGAVRWRCLLSATGLYRPSLSQALRLCYEGLFFNVLVPGSVGGDLLRAHWLRSRDQGGSKLHYVITLGERVLGMMSLGLLMSLGLSPLWALAYLTCLLGALLFTPQFIRALSAQPRAPGSWSARVLDTISPLAELKRGWVVLAFSVNCLGHLSSFALFILIAAELGVSLSAGAWFTSLSVSLFFANLPLSIAGLGPRELSLITTLGAYGVSREQALALSLSSLAILIIHASLGGLTHLIWPSRSR